MTCESATRTRGTSPTLSRGALHGGRGFSGQLWGIDFPVCGRRAGAASGAWCAKLRTLRKDRKLNEVTLQHYIDVAQFTAILLRGIVMLLRASGTKLGYYDFDFSFECSVSENEENRGLFLAARPLFEFLCCGQNLKKVRLTFGWLVDGALQTEFWSRNKGDGPQELLTLLTNYTLCAGKGRSRKEGLG